MQHFLSSLPVALLIVATLGTSAFSQLVPNTTVQLPTFGVTVDAEGVLRSESYDDPGGRLLRKRLESARGAFGEAVFSAARLRKIALLRLERALGRRIELGEAPDEVMRHLAGLRRVEYVFFYPSVPEIVLAGPAAGWAADCSGRMVSAGSGRPVLLLEDLVVALRAFAPARPSGLLVGCTIDPNPEGLARLRQFQRTIPRTVAQRQRAVIAARIATGMRESIGEADIRVFGVSPKTHLARVLIEADYRMKRIGIGLEPPPVKLMTFIQALKRPRDQTLQRWWFTPDYDCVRVTADRLAMQLEGQGVQLLGEDKLIGAEGALASSAGRLSQANRLFTTSFTRKYAEISAASPVFAQLRNMIDLTIVAAFIRREGLYHRTGWDLGVLGDEGALAVETTANPQRVPCAVNVVWKGNRMLVPAGGGVSIRPQLALERSRTIGDSHGPVARDYQQTSIGLEGTHWWWD